MIKYGHIEKPCRKHGYNMETPGCYYCYRRKLLGKYNSNHIRPEDILLQEIFRSGGRFFASRPIQKKVRDATRRKGTTSTFPTYSWTDGRRLVMG